MYIYIDDALQLDPHPPCSNVHYCPSVHYCTAVHYCSGVHWLPGGYWRPAFVRELVISFGMMGCIHPAIIKIVIHPAIIQPAIALHIVEGFDG